MGAHKVFDEFLNLAFLESSTSILVKIIEEGFEFGLVNLASSLGSADLSHEFEGFFFIKGS